MWARWLRICKKINGALEHFFEKWASLVTRHTILVIIISIIIPLGLAAGFVRFEQRNQGIRLYYPQSSTAWDELDKTENTFNSYVVDTNFMITIPSRDSDNKISGYNNVIRDDVFRMALQVHNEVIKSFGMYNDKPMTLRDKCIMLNNACLYANPLEVFDYNISKIQNVGAALKKAYMNKGQIFSSGRNLEMMMPALFGRYNTTGSDITATAVRFIYRTHFGKTLDLYKRNRAIDGAMEIVFEKYRTEAKKKGFQLLYKTEQTGDDSVDKNSGGNAVLVVIAISLMIVICTVFTVSLRDPVVGHFLMTIVGVGCVMFGLVGGFGLVLLSEQPYVAFVGVLPFLVLAVGVDDMFIVMDEVDTLDPTITGPQRLVIAIKHVGASITMTSTTDIIVFIVTATSDLPSIRWFCIYAAVSITFTYLLVMTLFIACFVYDIRRIESGRRDIVPCLKVPQRTADPWGLRITTVSEKVMEMFGTFLMKTPVKVAVVILYIALFAAGVYGTTQVTIGLDPKLAGEDGSAYVDYLIDMEVNFPTAQWHVSIVMQNSADYSLNKTQQYFQDINTIVAKSKYFKDTTHNAISEFISWTNQNGSSNVGTDFYKNLRLFLLAHQTYLPDFIFSSNNTEFLNTGKGTITATKVAVFPKDNHMWTFQKSAMNDIRSKLKEMTVGTALEFIPVSFNWVYVELLEVVAKDTGRNLGISAAVIFLTTLPFVLNPVIAVLMLFMFGGIVVLLFALMAAWDIELNGVPATIIILSIGFSVDYMAHIAHAYVVAEFNTPEQRMIFALKSVGRSVIKGGISTFVGVVVTAFSPSKMFVIFFKMMFGIVVLGLLHGLIVLPVFLTIFARTNLRLHGRNGSIKRKKEVVVLENPEVNESNGKPNDNNVSKPRNLPKDVPFEVIHYSPKNEIPDLWESKNPNENVNGDLPKGSLNKNDIVDVDAIVVIPNTQTINDDVDNKEIITNKNPEDNEELPATS